MAAAEDSPGSTSPPPDGDDDQAREEEGPPRRAQSKPPPPCGQRAVFSPTSDCRGEVRLAGSGAAAAASSSLVDAEQQLALSVGGVTVTLPQVTSIIEVLSKPLVTPVRAGRLKRDIHKDARVLRPCTSGDKGLLSLWMTPMGELRLVFTRNGASEEIASVVPGGTGSLAILPEDRSGRSFSVVGNALDRFYFWATSRDPRAAQDRLRAMSSCMARPPSLSERTGVPDGVLSALGATFLSGGQGVEPGAEQTEMDGEGGTGGSPEQHATVTFSATATAMTRCHLSGAIASATVSVEASAAAAEEARGAAELGAKREAEIAARARLEGLVAEDAAQLRHKQRVLAARLEAMQQRADGLFNRPQGPRGGGVRRGPPVDLPPGSKVDLARLEELLGRDCKVEGGLPRHSE